MTVRRRKRRRVDLTVRWKKRRRKMKRVGLTVRRRRVDWSVRKKLPIISSRCWRRTGAPGPDLPSCQTKAIPLPPCHFST